MTAGYVAGSERVVAVRRDAVVEWDALGRSPLLQGHIDIDGVVAMATSTDGSRVHAVTSEGSLVTLAAADGDVTRASAEVVRPASVVALGPWSVGIGGVGLAVVDARSGASRAQRADLDVVALAVDHASAPTRLAVATRGGDVLVLDTDLAAVAGPFPATTERITDLALTPDGTTIAVGTTGASTTDVLTLDARTGQVRTLTGHGAEVTGVAFSPDGALLATGSDDRSIIVWSTDDWQPEMVLSGHVDRVWRLAFTPDSKMLLSAGSDGTMRWWDVGSGAPIGLALRWVGRRPLDVRAGAGFAAVQDGQTVSTWRTAPSAWIDVACSIAARGLTDVEQATYLGRGPSACPRR
jgi:WD40 repeat protein